MPRKRKLTDEERIENRKAAQENYRHQARRFTFQFSLKDKEILEWFEKQPDKGKYLKKLILADIQQAEKETIEMAASEDEDHKMTM